MNVADHPTANRLRLLHTAASHVPRFGALLSELAPELSAQHVVCERLLDDARTGGGVDAALTRELGAVLESLAGSSAVVPAPARRSARLPKRWAGPSGRVYCASTGRSPGRRSLRAHGLLWWRLWRVPLSRRGSCSRRKPRANRPVSLTPSVCKGAWGYFERGDEHSYLRAVAEHVDEVQACGDVIVLAQASMAGAEALVCTTKPVLSSPRVGLLEALAVCLGDVSWKS